jgi:putative oxidoreductase
MKRLLQRLAQTTPISADLGLLIVRLWFGIVMAVAHGFPKFGKLDTFAAGLGEKGYPIPYAMALLATLSEALGGVLLAVGLLTRPAALTMVVTMAVAAFVAHADDPFQKVEFALAYGVAALAIAIAGPGRFSLDARLFPSPPSTHEKG